jgi:hypothetical protein
VRRLAAERDVPVSALSLSDHAAIDGETVVWSRQAGNRIVEGRFLDQVLVPSVPHTLIQVVAGREARAERWARRLSKPQSVEDVATFDAEDEAFRVQAYGATARLSPHFTIDTTGRSAEACLEEIESHLER